MKNRIGGIAVVASWLLIAMPSATTAQESMVPMAYETGNDYLRLSYVPRVTYISGAFDGIIMGGVISHNNSLVNSIGACIRNMQAGQATAIVDKYLQDNPSQWDWAMSIIIPRALFQACNERGVKLESN